MINYDEIMNRIVEANKKNSEITNSKDYIKTDIIGNTIVGRFLPNLSDIEHSVQEFCHHGWKSKLDNSGIFQLCPNTYRQKCPTCNKSITGWKGSDPVAKDQSKLIRRRQNWLVNFYIINDAKHPENNGQIKILKYGKQIKDKYDMATMGDDKEIYGPKIWRLDEQGCNFRIKCEQNSESKEAWPTYTNSGFLPPSKIEGMTDEKIKEILSKVFNLTTLFEKKSYDELLDEVNKHFFTNDVMPISTAQAPTTERLTSAPRTTTAQVDEDDHLEGIPNPKPAATLTTAATPTATGVAEQTTETELDKMLRELQTEQPKV